MVEQKYMLILFPACFDKWKYVDNMIEQNLFVIDKRIIELNEKVKFELIYDLYKGEEWVGNSDNNWEGINYKKNACFPNEITTVKFFYVLSNENKVKMIKNEIRNFCKCGNHSIHSTDDEITANELKMKYFTFNIE